MNAVGESAEENGGKNELSRWKMADFIAGTLGMDVSPVGDRAEPGTAAGQCPEGFLAPGSVGCAGLWPQHEMFKLNLTHFVLVLFCAGSSHCWIFGRFFWGLCRIHLESARSHLRGIFILLLKKLGRGWKMANPPKVRRTGAFPIPIIKIF